MNYMKKVAEDVRFRRSVSREEVSFIWPSFLFQECFNLAPPTVLAGYLCLFCWGNLCLELGAIQVN